MISLITKNTMKMRHTGCNQMVLMVQILDMLK